MSEEVRPVIIRRKKVVAKGGHHGGAWKVAYADFVTAMMAFFLMMWLLNSTTEDQRRGLADYFSPSIPLSQSSDGGNGLFSGTDPAENESMLEKTGATEEGDETAMNALMEEIIAGLTATSGESTVADPALDHIITRVTDEGLAVDLFDLPGAPLFEEGGAIPTALGRNLLDLVDRVFSEQTNRIAVGSHVGSDAVVKRLSGIWPVSAARGETARRTFEDGMTGGDRIERTSAHGDRKPVEYDRMDPRNNRLELILLRD